MPPYDPKAKRPKLVPVDDDAAPVDALLGPDSSRDAEPAPRSHLSVVPPDEPAPAAPPRPASVASPQPASSTSAVESPSRRPDAKTMAAVVVAVVAVVGLIVVARRRP